MELVEIQRLVEANNERYGKKHGIEMTVEYLLLKFVEESGEFAGALLVQQGKTRAEKHVDSDTAKQMVAAELADVFTTILGLAAKLDIDLFSALEAKALAKGRTYLAENKTDGSDRP